MAELPPKPLRPASGGDGDGEPIPAPNSQNPNFPSSQIAPSPYSDLPQISSPQLPPSQPQIIPSAALDYASKQQQHHHHQQQSVPTPHQQRLMSPSSGLPVQPNLQQSGSLMRMSQIHQQLGAAVAANTMRQHSGMYGGQMSFGGPQIPQQQQGNLQMGGGQHLNMQSQIFVQPRQKMGLVQGTQIHTANSSEQALQGMTHGMMGSIGLNSQPRANGAHSYGQQRFTPGQMRQQLLSQQTPLTSQKLIGQSLPRTLSHAAMNPQLSGLTQNGQSALTQSTLSQQPWLKQIQPAMSSPVSPSYHPQQQRQQQAFLPQQLSSSQLHEKFMGLNQQQISQLVQQQPLLGLQQHQPQQHHMFPQHQQQLPQQLSLQQQQQQLQELSPRVPGPTVQKTISLTGSQSDTPAVGVTASGSSRKGTEASNQLLGKRKIQDLVALVDSRGKLDPEVEDLLLEIADNFIASVTTFACSLAKHRKSSTLESKDVLLHLEKNWHLTIPGYSREENKCQRNTIRALMECQQSERETNGAKCNTRQVLNDSVIIPSLRPERLVLPAAASQMMPNVTRF